MQKIDQVIRLLVVDAIRETWGDPPGEEQVQIQKTRREFIGDFTVVVFPLLRYSKLSPEETGKVLGKYLLAHSDLLSDFNVIKGFLNLVVSQKYWKDFLDSDLRVVSFGTVTIDGESPLVMIEYSSPNTNKPLHLGHIRNNLLGHSISLILEATGNEVRKVNLVNDRGIHICKSMLAWKKEGKGEDPESSGKKGDHLVGDYYVRYDQMYKSQVQELVDQGVRKAEAEAGAPILQEAREMLRKWEAEDPEVRSLWNTMNGWVYKGFEST
ncbi:MAG: arginine--tRNA ligase, partial [Bacteroidia bacterium]